MANTESDETSGAHTTPASPPRVTPPIATSTCRGTEDSESRGKGDTAASHAGVISAGGKREGGWPRAAALPGGRTRTFSYNFMQYAHGFDVAAGAKDIRGQARLQRVIGQAQRAGGGACHAAHTRV